MQEKCALWPLVSAPALGQPQGWRQAQATLAGERQAGRASPRTAPAALGAPPRTAGRPRRRNLRVGCRPPSTPQPQGWLPAALDRLCDPRPICWRSDTLDDASGAARGGGRLAPRAAAAGPGRFSRAGRRGKRWPSRLRPGRGEGVRTVRAAVEGQPVLIAGHL